MPAAESPATPSKIYVSLIFDGLFDCIIGPIISSSFRHNVLKISSFIASFIRFDALRARKLSARSVLNLQWAIGCQKVECPFGFKSAIGHWMP